VYLQSPVSHGAGQFISLEDYEFGNVVSSSFQVAGGVQLLLVNEATVNDVQYRANDIVLNHDKCSGQNVEFCIVKEIVLIKSDAYLICSCSSVEYFDCHKNAYFITKNDAMLAVNPDNLHIPWPVLWRPGCSSDTYFVSPLCCSDVEVIV